MAAVLGAVPATAEGEASRLLRGLDKHRDCQVWGPCSQRAGTVTGALMVQALTPLLFPQVSVCVVVRGVAGDRAVSRSRCALVKGG